MYTKEDYSVWLATPLYQIRLILIIYYKKKKKIFEKFTHFDFFLVEERVFLSIFKMNVH